MSVLKEVDYSRVTVRPGKFPHIYGHDLLDYAKAIVEQYVHNSNSEERKSKGQFFTPKEVSLFMACLLDIKPGEIRLLDPGAGIGTLSVAFCQRLIELNSKCRLSIVAYENDTKLLPLLENALKKCVMALENKGHTVEYEIVARDFILDNAKFLRTNSLGLWDSERKPFDYVISNPPYYKLNIDSPQAVALQELVSGQPNIYPFFMALGLSLLKDSGEMVFITPRSFCSGLYYRKFRKWFLSNADIRHIHLFESRSEIFEHDEVLQENVICKAKLLREHALRKPATISVSRSKDFEGVRKYYVSFTDLIHKINGDAVIKIPSTKLDIEVQHLLKRWRFTLKDFGLNVSTGPVVAFRAKEYLKDFKDTESTAPLLWMHNIRGMDVHWPIRKDGKHEAIKLSKETYPLVLPVKNYVLVKRFSSKEQRRRLYSGVLLKHSFSRYKKLGIENHINYIHRPGGTLTQEETFGIAAILNTSIVDVFFRSVNGNTQVNASDIKTLPLPPHDIIERIGKVVSEKKPQIGEELDQIVEGILGIKELHKYVSELPEENEKN